MNILYSMYLLNIVNNHKFKIHIHKLFILLGFEYKFEKNCKKSINALKFRKMYWNVKQYLILTLNLFLLENMYKKVTQLFKYIYVYYYFRVD